MRRALVVALLLVLSCGTPMLAGAAPAFADGDPASDVLAYDSLFDPPDAHSTPAQRARLEALINYLRSHGYPLKVALIASASDLGTATNYWEDATDYAGKYLGIELSLILHDQTLLVIMPQTDGLYDPVPVQDVPPGDAKAMQDLAPAGSNLTGGAEAIIRRLAADNGISLPKTFSAKAPAPVRHSSSAIPLVGFIVGVVIVLGAWGLSLRVRPARRATLV